MQATEQKPRSRGGCYGPACPFSANTADVGRVVDGWWVVWVWVCGRVGVRLLHVTAPLGSTSTPHSRHFDATLE